MGVVCFHIPTGPHWLPLHHRSSVAFRSWLYDLCRGIDDEPVKNRHLPQSIGCSKNFPGKTALATQKEVGKANILQKETQLLDWRIKERTPKAEIGLQNYCFSVPWYPETEARGLVAGSNLDR